MTLFLFIDVCALVYQCGCANWLAGGLAKCNIHMNYGHKCPFCQLSGGKAEALEGLVIVAQGVLVRRRQWAAAVLAFPVLAALEMAVLGWYVGYWG